MKLMAVQITWAGKVVATFLRGGMRAAPTAEPCEQPAVGSSGARREQLRAPLHHRLFECLALAGRPRVAFGQPLKRGSSAACGPALMFVRRRLIEAKAQ
jgi:hypothetical protein